MPKSPADKLILKRHLLAERTAMALALRPAEAQQLLRTPRQQSLRLNPLRAPSNTLKILADIGWQGQVIPWCPQGYTIEAGLEAIRDSQLVKAGAVYIQNAASWLPVLALDPRPHETILDICAAPGGKTSHIAALANNQAYITANDNSRPRLAKLQANLERLGAQNITYTLYDATQLGRRLAGQQFDKILLDAPCGGEGMMRYDQDKDFQTWSVAHIKRLQQLQKRMLMQAWQLLKPGGTLVYSTCTMAPEENEAVIDYLLQHQEDVSVGQLSMALPNRVSAVRTWRGKSYRPAITQALRLKPSNTIEAFFVCKLNKLDIY